MTLITLTRPTCVFYLNREDYISLIRFRIDSLTARAPVQKADLQAEELALPVSGDVNRAATG